MLNGPFSPWPSFTEEEADAVARVLRSNRVNYWTGTECREFEAEFAAWSGAAYAISLANGTLALDLALKALRIGPGDEVVVTPRSYFASAATVVNAGAVPVFADVDAESQNLTAQTIQQVLTPRTRAILCVHLSGWPCDMDPIMALAKSRGLFVIEDCAQAHGARYNERSVGTIGDIGTWSFCQDKIITTGGEGGMVTTSSKELWSVMWAQKDHGKSWDAIHGREHPPGFRWVHESFGSNWRLTEMQAAIGRIQLGRMPAWHAQRTRHAERLATRLRRVRGLRVPQPADGVEHAWYRFSCFVVPSELAPGWDRDRIISELTSAGVPCLVGGCPEIYLEKAFDGTGWRPQERLPVAQELGRTSLAFLVHPTLSDAEIDHTCAVMEQVMGAAVETAPSQSGVR